MPIIANAFIILLIVGATAKMESNLSEVNIKISLIDNPLPASI